VSRLDEFLRSQIPGILREPAGLLRHPFFVPGGIFHDELWDWDSFWIAKAVLSEPGIDPDLQAVFLRHAEGSWKNFFEHQGANGAVPIMVKSDRPDFFGCIEEGGRESNQAKPVFAQFAWEISRAKSDFQWLRDHFDGLLRFLRRWRHRYGAGCGLLVWGSDVAIGVDCDPTTYGRPEFSSANLLLNCLYFRDLEAAAALADELGRPADAGALRAEAEALAAAIRRECWDEIDGFFYTVDASCADHRDRYLPGLKKGMAMNWRTLPLKVRVFTGFLPLWCGIATPDQAMILVSRHLRKTCHFHAAWGIRSLARTEPMYDPETDSANPSNWLGPVWIVANYLVWEGLVRFGLHDDAASLADKTRRLLENDLARTGTLHECYHPDTGAPNFNANFLSWNLLALRMRAG
jgi:putative isomerase